MITRRYRNSAEIGDFAAVSVNTVAYSGTGTVDVGVPVVIGVPRIELWTLHSSHSLIEVRDKVIIYFYCNIRWAI